MKTNVAIKPDLSMGNFLTYKEVKQTPGMYRARGYEGAVFITLTDGSTKTTLLCSPTLGVCPTADSWGNHLFVPLTNCTVNLEFQS